MYYLGIQVSENQRFPVNALHDKKFSAGGWTLGWIFETEF